MIIRSWPVSGSPPRDAAVHKQTVRPRASPGPRRYAVNRIPPAIQLLTVPERCKFADPDVGECNTVFCEICPNAMLLRPSNA
ncbi:hypothetical protein [Amycolatopsis stemonae]